MANCGWSDVDASDYCYDCAQSHRVTGRRFNRLYEHACIKVAIIVVLRPKSCDVCDALGSAIARWL